MSEFEKQKQKRSNVANDNKEIVKNNLLPLTINKPFVINLNKNIRPIYNKGKKLTELLLFEGTTNQAIHHFNKLSLKCAVFNYGNSIHVGGGYLKGSIAQEEELCRTIPDLFPSLDLLASKHYYGDNFTWYKHVLYSSNLSLYRLDNIQSNNNYDIFTDDPIKVSVITIAAPDLKKNSKDIIYFIEHSDDIFNKLYKVIHAAIMSPILASRKGVENNVNVLIVGAIGCGAFCPSKELQETLNIKYTEKIAEIYIKVLQETQNILTVYDYICFAIPKGENHEIFKKVFEEHNII